MLKMVIRSICPTLKGSNKTKFCTQNALDNIVIHLCVAIYPLKSFEFLSQKFSSALHNYDEEGFCAKLVEFRIVPRIQLLLWKIIGVNQVNWNMKLNF